MSGFEYFRTTYCHIILKSGAIVPWTDPYPIQIQAAAEWLSGESTIEAKSRQLGQTTNSTHVALYECITSEAVIWNFFGADADASKDMKRRLDATLDRLPKWLLERGRATRGSIEAKKGEEKSQRKHSQEAATILTFGLSMIRVFTGSVKKAQGLTGKTLWDDAGKHTDPERKWQLLYPTIDDPDPSNRGQVIIIFNGNGEDYLYHLAMRAKAGENNLTYHFYSWRDDPRRLYATDPSTNEGPRSIIATKAEHFPWYDNAYAQYMADPKNADKSVSAFKAQFPDTEEECFHISENSRFEVTKIQGFEKCAAALPPGRRGLVERIEEEVRFHITSNGRIDRYEEPVKGGVYILTADPAGGHADSDYSAMQVFRFYQNKQSEIDELLDKYGYRNPPTINGQPAFEFQETLAVLEQVACYRSKTEPVLLGSQAMRLGEYYNNALLLPEANNHGHTFVEVVKDEYRNLYKEERKTALTDEESDRIGFWTGPTTKGPLIDHLAAWLSNGWIFLRDPATFSELKMYGFHESAGGAVTLGAPKGSNDDTVSCTALAVVGARSLICPRSNAAKKTYRPWWQY